MKFYLILNNRSRNCYCATCCSSLNIRMVLLRVLRRNRHLTLLGTACAGAVVSILLLNRYFVRLKLVRPCVGGYSWVLGQSGRVFCKLIAVIMLVRVVRSCSSRFRYLSRRDKPSSGTSSHQHPHAPQSIPQLYLHQLTTPYQRLMKNSFSVEGGHPLVDHFDVSFLGSNSPIEDRFVAGVSPALGAALFSVIDGHKSFQLAEYLQKELLQSVVSTLSPGSDDLSVLADMTSGVRDGLEGVGRVVSTGLDPATVEARLKKAFTALDNSVSSAALEDAKKIRRGQSLSPEMRERIVRALTGACVVLAMVQDGHLYVSNTGDCRVVLGTRMPNGSWEAKALSMDQNAENPSEMKRVLSEHPPNEKRTVVIENRILGNLMPFRSFGDVDFKWDAQYLKGVVQFMPSNYLTPPYVTAEPVVTSHPLQKGDHFMIVASDGFWERVGNEEAVNVVVSQCMSPANDGSRLQFLKKERKVVGCASAELLWHALGGTEQKVSDLMNVAPSVSRMYRDDITIIVVFFSVQ